MDITRAYMEQFRKNESSVTLPSGEELPVTTIQPGLRVGSRLFLRADNAPEFYVSLSGPVPEETALLVMPDGRAVFVPASRIEEAGLDKELPPVGVPFFSAFYPISGMPGERLALTCPIPKGRLLMAGSTGRASMIELHGVFRTVGLERAKRRLSLLPASFSTPTRERFLLRLQTGASPAPTP